jgi:hypothetical protein
MNCENNIVYNSDGYIDYSWLQPTKNELIKITIKTKTKTNNNIFNNIINIKTNKYIYNYNHC